MLIAAVVLSMTQTFCKQSKHPFGGVEVLIILEFKQIKISVLENENVHNSRALTLQTAHTLRNN